MLSSSDNPCSLRYIITSLQPIERESPLSGYVENLLVFRPCFEE
ncbi:hypothetical protein PORCRE_469 [Porphyromonas crevioricanis JCM 15906]|uniref:Uncharacterized protein n=1 Tax=Porphyromonas crevioricanis JCM 15906 TaxID=1305617 RepID=T1CNU5_9PORP|nr:hypothetical protein PORCRE_469 [Porphyromonas crevioricanis JCM 15906]GAD08191.1 hypothetical protein PORCAN_1827 [Porphyromonas crevioricanis JCM 13913]